MYSEHSLAKTNDICRPNLELFTYCSPLIFTLSSVYNQIVLEDHKVLYNSTVRISIDSRYKFYSNANIKPKKKKIKKKYSHSTFHFVCFALFRFFLTAQSTLTLGRFNSPETKTKTTTLTARATTLTAI